MTIAYIPAITQGAYLRRKVLQAKKIEAIILSARNASIPFWFMKSAISELPSVAPEFKPIVVVVKSVI